MSLGFSEEDLIKDIKKLISGSVLKPEPPFNLCCKYLATKAAEKSSENEALLHLVNSVGNSVKDTVKFFDSKRRDPSAANYKKECPVVEASHLEPFKSYDSLLEKLKEMPPEWTIIQVTREIDGYDVTEKLKDNHDPGVNIIRFACGKLAESIPPYFVSIKANAQNEGNILSVLKGLIKTRSEYYKTGMFNRTLREEYSKTDSGLTSFVKEIENHWLKEWKCLFNGRLEDEKLEAETRDLIRESIDAFFVKKDENLKLSEKCLDMIYLATLSAKIMKNKDLVNVLKHALRDFVSNDENWNDCLPFVDKLKRFNLNGDCAVVRTLKKPVILIVDQVFEEIPWERIGALNGQPVTRIASVGLLYSLFKHHKSSIVNGYRIVEIDNAYSLVNPGKDLQKCEKYLKQFFQKEMPWVERDLGIKPDPEKLLSHFTNYSLYIYCGHGAGTQFLNASKLPETTVKAMLLFFGCSSNFPKNHGKKTPPQNHTYTYIVNGCPNVIGFLHDVNSTEVDNVCVDFLSKIMPTVTENGSEKRLEEPKECDVLKALNLAKKAAKKYWTGSAFVSRGIPCRTVRGNVTLAK